jgi:hypothetical protein
MVRLMTITGNKRSGEYYTSLSQFAYKRNGVLHVQIRTVMNFRMKRAAQVHRERRINRAIGLAEAVLIHHSAEVTDMKVNTLRKNIEWLKCFQRWHAKISSRIADRRERQDQCRIQWHQCKLRIEERRRQMCSSCNNQRTRVVKTVSWILANRKFQCGHCNQQDRPFNMSCSGTCSCYDPTEMTCYQCDLCGDEYIEDTMPFSREPLFSNYTGMGKRTKWYTHKYPIRAYPYTINNIRKFISLLHTCVGLRRLCW